MAVLSRRRFLGAAPGFVAVALRELHTAEAHPHRRRFFDQRWPASETIIVENRMGREWNEAVKFTVREWHRAFPRLRFRVEHRRGGCPWRQGRIVLCEVKPNQSWSGFTLGWWDGHAVLGMRVRINRHLDPHEPMWNEHISMFDMATLCHEFGHALNLKHNPRPRSSCVAPASTRITPGKYDQQSLKMLYNRRGPGWP